MPLIYISTPPASDTVSMLAEGWANAVALAQPSASVEQRCIICKMATIMRDPLLSCGGRQTHASFTPVRHLRSVIRHPSSVISRPLQSRPFTPISLFRAVDTDFCVPTVLNRYSPGK